MTICTHTKSTYILKISSTPNYIYLICNIFICWVLFVNWLSEHCPGTGSVLLSFLQRQEERCETCVEISADIDHPFFVSGHGWSSCSPSSSLDRYKVYKLFIIVFIHLFHSFVFSYCYLDTTWCADNCGWETRASPSPSHAEPSDESSV